MNKYNNNIFDLRLSDILIALSLLTRIPVNLDHQDVDERAKQATWAYPLVGALIGAFAALIANIANFFGLPFSICAILSLITNSICACLDIKLPALVLCEHLFLRPVHTDNL